MSRVLLLVVLLTGCLSWGKNQSPLERYYALQTDYLTLESQAVAYCEAPTTPADHCRRIGLVIEKALRAKETFDAAALAGDATSGAEQAALVLQTLSAELLNILKERQ